jgi:hypothetical protein
MVGITGAAALRTSKQASAAKTLCTLPVITDSESTRLCNTQAQGERVHFSDFTRIQRIKRLERGEEKQIRTFIRTQGRN